MAKLSSFVKWFVMEFYPSRRVGRAVLLEEKLIPRLEEGEITFFTPWGPRYSYLERGTTIKPSDKEWLTLDYLSKSMEEIKSHAEWRKVHWIFLAADLYGTKINGLPEEAVREYFMSLQEAINEIIPQAEFQYWSEYGSIAMPYRASMSELIDSGFCQLDTDLLKRAQTTASKMQRNSDPTEYLMERAIEAMVIEEMYQPIKLSCVERYKDDKVDLGLPRLYIVPEELTAPWM